MQLACKCLAAAPILIWGFYTVQCLVCFPGGKYPLCVLGVGGKKDSNCACGVRLKHTNLSPKMTVCWLWDWNWANLFPNVCPFPHQSLSIFINSCLGAFPNHWHLARKVGGWGVRGRKGWWTQIKTRLEEVWNEWEVKRMNGRMERRQGVDTGEWGRSPAGHPSLSEVRFRNHWEGRADCDLQNASRAQASWNQEV